VHEEPSIAEVEPDADNASTSDKSEAQDEVASARNSTSGPHPPPSGLDQTNAKDTTTGSVGEGATAANQTIKGQ